MAIETEGGTYINVNGNEEKGHVNIYDSDPRGEHNSIHININYDEETFTITEKENDKKTSEKHKCFLTYFRCISSYFFYIFPKIFNENQNIIIF